MFCYPRICASLLSIFTLLSWSRGQGNVSLPEWKAFHEKDVSKWSNKLPVSEIRAILAATAGEQGDDNQYMIENIDATRLAKRHHVLVSTQGFGSGHCMEVYVIERKGRDYRHLWQASSIEGISNLCTESLLGAATARVAKEGFVVVSFPMRHSGSPGTNFGGESELVVARFEWNGRSYQLGRVQRFLSYRWDGNDWAVVLTRK